MNETVTEIKSQSWHVPAGIVLGAAALFLAVVSLPGELLSAGGLLALWGLTYLMARQQKRLRRYIEALRQHSTSSATLAAHLLLINRAANDMLTHLNRRTAWQTACHAALVIGRAKAAAIFLPDASASALQLTDSTGLNEGQTARYALLPLWQHRETVIVTNAADSDADPALVDLARRGGFVALTVVPLFTSSTPSGSLVLFYDQPHTPAAKQVELLESLAAQVMVIIDNADLFAALEHYAFEMTQLAHLSRISTSNLDLDKMSADAAQILCQIMNMNQVVITLVDEDTPYRLRPVAAYSTDTNTFSWRDYLNFPEMDMLLRQGSHRARLFRADDSDHSPSLMNLLLRHECALLVVVPMVMAEALVGMILLASREQRTFDARQWELLETATNQLAIHIENARLYTTTRRALGQRLEQLALIEDIARQISSSLDFQQVIEHIIEAAQRSTQANLVTLALLNDMGALTVTAQEYGFAGSGDVRRRSYTLDSNVGAAGHVIRSGRQIIIPDNRRFPDYFSPDGEIRYLSSLALPLLRDKKVIGVLTVESVRENFFTEESARFLTNLADHALISITNARMVEEQRYQVSILASLQSLAAQLSSAVDRMKVAGALLETSLNLFAGQEAILFECESNVATIKPLLSQRGDAAQPSLAESPLVMQVAREAAHTGEIQIDQHVRHSGEAQMRATSLACIPLKRGDSVGEVLCVIYTDQHTFSRRDLDTLTLLASQSSGHLENATLYEQIRKGNNRMSAILRSTRDGLILLDQAGNLVEANPAAHRLLEDDLTSYIHSAAWAQEQPAETRRRFERKLATQSLYIEEVVTPVEDVNGASMGHLLVLRDVTEEKLLQDYRDEITNMVVHDLRGPLASIISGVQLVMDEISRVEHEPFLMQTLSLSSDSADKLMQLISTLLDIAKLEAREMLLRPAPVSVARLVDQSVKMLATTAQRAGIDLRVEIPSDLVPVCVDQEMIQRALINLLDNAISFTPSWGEVLVSAQMSAAGDQVEVSVADSGPGIPVSERERIFQKFRQIKGSKMEYSKRGTGLGLTFCKLAVEAHGGRIWVADSCLLPGACIRFTLPVTPSDVEKISGC